MGKAKKPNGLTAEKAISLGKRGTLASRRMARVIINDRAVLQKLFSTIADRYKDRPGGYTRIVKLGIRPGDSAPMSVIQLVQDELPADSKPAKKAPKKVAATPTKADAKPVAAKSEDAGAVKEDKEATVAEVEADEKK